MSAIAAGVFYDLRDLDNRASGSGSDGWDGVVAGRHRHCRDRVLRHQGAVLVNADDVPDRCRRSGRHCLDQLARQSRRLFGPSIVGWAKQLTGGLPAAYALALCAVASAVVSLFGPKIRDAVRSPAHAAALAE